ncbi:uncharacterized protein [Palaemon carinicauda]|uniref:uncharacterized protein n=1 Tax=Palaemon carinicauda TaxID=392227 RepID=UPI0035B62BD1
MPVTMQVIHGLPHPLAFFSRKLFKAESSYSSFNHELLPVNLAVRQFHHFLEDSPFVILTDHRPQMSPPTSQGQRYLFTIIGLSTHWPETIPLGTTTSASCTSALLSGWLARLGIPDHNTSDRCTTFTSQLWTPLVNLLGITRHQTITSNTVVNRRVESFHRTLKAAFMSSFPVSSWD